MRLTVLGSGTCVPDATRLPSGYWLEVGDAQIRLDCGPGTVHATTRYPHLDWRKQTHLLISHFHVDHIGDIPTLLFAFKYGRQPAPRGPLTLVGPAGLSEMVVEMARTIEPKLLEQEFPLSFVEIAANSSCRLTDKVNLYTCKTPHTPESMAYRIVGPDGRQFAYTGDTGPEWQRLPAFVQGVDVLVAECSHREPTPTAHLTVADVQRLAAIAQPRRLVTVHHYFDPEAAGLAAELAAALPDTEVYVGRDGLVLAW